MNHPKYDRKHLPFLLQTLYQPALFISLVLHGLLLVVPIPERSHSSSDNSPQAKKTIALTDLLASPKPSARPASPQPQPKASPSTAKPTSENSAPKITPQPQAIAPSVQSQPSAIPTPSSRATPSPSPTPSSTPAAEASATPTPAVTPTLPLEENPNTVQNFFEQLAATTGVPVNPPSPNLFHDPSLYFDSAETEPTLKSDILRAVWMDGKTPEQVYISVLSSQLQSGNFQTEQKPDYGGGTVYKIRQDDSVWYLNLVPTTDGKGTIIVVWNREPSRPVLHQ
ncbi:MAG: hypothetical protein F6K28_24320 [Microcoleus sp. SIO2G3]|nr:hypothetical protein [Microcoleus sp. SIO2G3]